MTISDQYRPENSTRGKVLYDKIKPHIKDGVFILDVGCSHSAISTHIRADFPKCELFGFDNNGAIINELRKTRPYYRWERVAIEQGNELERFNLAIPDIVIHTGVNGAWSNIWRIHEWLFENNLVPDLALFETGRKDGYEQCMEIYAKLTVLYFQNGFQLLDHGRIEFDYEHATLRERYYCVLGK